MDVRVAEVAVLRMAAPAIITARVASTLAPSSPLAAAIAFPSRVMLSASPSSDAAGF